MKVAMISGANRGIGLAIARKLAQEGYALSLGIRRPDAFTDDLARGPNVLLQRYEAAERDAAAPWVAATVARFGRIDALVANAGIAPFVGIEEGTDEALDEMFEINVKAPFRLIQAALPKLRATGSGRVVTVASLSGKRVKNLNVGYQMSKHAVVALTHAVRRLGWDDGVRATALCPGFVETDLTAKVTDVARKDMTHPDDLAELVATVLALPNTATVGELLVNCRYEPML